MALLAACEGDDGSMGAMGAMGIPGTNGTPGTPGTPGANGTDAGTPPPAACTPGTLPAGLPASAMALTSTGKLVRFTPGSTAGGNVVNVLGLQANEALVGIDFRPADGALIGVTKNGAAGAVVRIDSVTGETTRLTATGATVLSLNGTRYGVDFNPVPGALRIVGDNEENYRLVFSGAGLTNYAVNTDTALSPAGNIAAAAYTNSFAGTPVTTIYNLDSAANALLTQGTVDGVVSPNGGVLTSVGALGVDFEDTAGFDVDGVTGVALATLNLSGATSTGVYSVDLGTGAATCVGTVPAPIGQLAVGLAIPTPLPAVAFGLTTSDALVSFTPNAAGVATVTTVGPITGVAGGETIVGMDFRPRTGALTIVTANGLNGFVYQVDTVTGAATLIPANSTALTFTGAPTAFGVDFNPVPNALRIVNNSNDNLRLTFPAGTAGYDVNVDLAINSSTTSVGGSSGAGYTSNFDGSTATRLYVIDTTTNDLRFQSPPNNGTQTSVGSLGVTAADTNSGMDIIGGAGVTAAGVSIGNTVTYAALTVAGASNLYRINLQTGAATQVGAVPIGGGTPLSLKGLAVRVRK